MKSKKRQKELLISIFSMIMCLLMFVGTSFAWFTDSVTSGQNKVIAGNLNIELEYTTDFNTWNDVQDVENLFQNDVRWEPGHAEVVYLRIKNEGSLAFKYQFKMNIEETQATNVKGDTFSLSDHLKYGVIEGQQVQFSNREEAIKAVNNPTSLSEYSKEESMEANSIEYLTIVVYMPENVGNEANYIGKEPSITIGINLVAKQNSFESDSFGNDYDKGAEYPITNQKDFEEALNSVKPGDYLKLSSGTYSMPQENYVIPDNVNIIGEDGTYITVNHGNTNSSSGLLLEGNNIKISNITMNSKRYSQEKGTGFIRITGNNIVIDNVTFPGHNNEYASPIVICNTSDDNVVTIKNSKITSKKERAIFIVDGANGTVNIENCEINAVYPISVNSNSSQQLTLNVSNSKLNGWTSYGNILSANFTDTVFGKAYKQNFIRPYANTSFTNCTFNEGFKMGAGAIEKTYTITNSNVNGTLLTAENIENLLLDMGEFDGNNLRECTIVVDGISITPGAYNET